jgi:sigma-B regulation protein RsbU (phosphoserine phosphatase)
VLAAFIALLALRILTSSRFEFVNLLGGIAFLAALVLGAVVLLRLVMRRLFWRVRNRLFVTYLLLGLAPIILFGVLTVCAAYLFAGQYATNTALRSLDSAAHEVRSESGDLAMLSMMNAVPTRPPVFNHDEKQPTAVAAVALATREGNLWHDLNKGRNSLTPRSAFDGQTSPPWLKAGFQGLVDLNGQLYLCSESEATLNGRSGFVLASMPITPATMQPIAKGLGTIVLLPGQFGNKRRSKSSSETSHKKKSEDSEDQTDVDVGDLFFSRSFERVRAGTLPAARNLLDTRVAFSAPLSVQNWETGEAEPALLFVVSRTSLLYAQLFSTSARIGTFVRVALLIATITVLCIELLAVLMAVALSRTITRSIAALYRGTSEIDHGNLAYRVPARGHDQLTALINSFNTMSGSMQELMVQQREKERLESELSIAQDVQRSLFPISPLRYSGLEVHAVCIPARVVSGDYYDFFAGEAQLCIALGDISGKGMSAALLMASLHAAVRSLGLSVEAAADGGEPSSARLFGLLNRQLFESTQPERYATLFLTFYDRDRRKLTYTNGGHLAPWLIARDGSYRALDRGGPVVGLLSGLIYQQAILDCGDGDLLVVFSDGITEAENDVSEFGEARLLAYISANRSLPLRELASGALDLVRAWTGGAEQADDMTILLARVG